MAVSVVPEEGPFVFGAYAAHLSGAARLDQDVPTGAECDHADRQPPTEAEALQGTVGTALC